MLTSKKENNLNLKLDYFISMEEGKRDGTQEHIALSDSFVFGRVTREASTLLCCPSKTASGNSNGDEVVTCPHCLKLAKRLEGRIVDIYICGMDEVRARIKHLTDKNPEKGSDDFIELKQLEYQIEAELEPSFGQYLPNVWAW